MCINLKVRYISPYHAIQISDQTSDVPATGVSVILGRSAVMISTNTDYNMATTWFKRTSNGDQPIQV